MQLFLLCVLLISVGLVQHALWELHWRGEQARVLEKVYLLQSMERSLQVIEALYDVSNHMLTDPSKAVVASFVAGLRKDIVNRVGPPPVNNETVLVDGAKYLWPYDKNGQVLKP